MLQSDITRDHFPSLEMLKEKIKKKKIKNFYWQKKLTKNLSFQFVMLNVET